MEQLAEGTEAPLADGSPPGPLSIPSLRVFSSPCRSQQSIPNLISLLSPQGSLGKPAIITWGPKGDLLHGLVMQKHRMLGALYYSLFCIELTNVISGGDDMHRAQIYFSIYFLCWSSLCNLGWLLHVWSFCLTHPSATIQWHELLFQVNIEPHQVTPLELSHCGVRLF